MHQSQAQQHLGRHQQHLPSPLKAKNGKISPSMTGWQFLHSLTLILASHKQVYAIISNPSLMVPLSLTKPLSHGSSRSEKRLRLMQPHSSMQCQPNASALSHTLKSIGPCISGSRAWRLKVRWWLETCCAQSEGFLSKSLECLRRLSCKGRGGWLHSEKHRSGVY